MRFPITKAIYLKEILDMVRDRRTLISMVAVPLLVIPLLLNVMTRVMSRVEKKAEEESKSMALAVKVTTPAVRQAIENMGLRLVEKDDYKSAIEKKEIGAAIEETPGTPPVIHIYVDRSNPSSSAPADLVRTPPIDLKNQQVRANLTDSGI